MVAYRVASLRCSGFMTRGDEKHELSRTVYRELHRLARARRRRLKPGQTLQTTALVHEAYLRLQRKPNVQWSDRRHFFGAAAMAMRDILVEAVRHKGALKRGGDQQQVNVPLSSLISALSMSPEETLSLHHALERMQTSLPEHAEIVWLHCFAGLSLDEVSAVMTVPKRTVERRWRGARAWLLVQMRGS